MPRMLSILAAAVVCFQATAQDADHRPVRPKGRYFTQDQLQRALQSAKDAPASGKKSDQPPQLSEATKSLIDFAKDHPDLTKSLLDAAKQLARDNPDLLRGGNDEAAKRLAEQMAKQSNLGELLKGLEKKPPPSNVKRKPSDKSDENGRRTRNKGAENKNGATDPQEQPKQDSNGDPQPQPQPRPEQGTDAPKKSSSPLADLADQSPDFVKSLLDQAKINADDGKAPTKEQVDEAVKKATEQMKNDPAYADWINQPKTQEKINSPKLRDDVMKQFAPRAPSNGGRRRPKSDQSKQPEQQPSNETPERTETPHQNQSDANEQPTKSGERRTGEAPFKKSSAGDDRGLRDLINSMRNDRTKKADDARKAVAKEMEENRRRPGEREPSNEQPPSKESPTKPDVNQIADFLKQNPGLVESLAKSASGGGENGGEASPKENLKGMLDAFKGTELEKEMRDFAKELNKDGSLNDLLKGRDESEQLGKSSPRERPRESSGQPPVRSAAEEASKALKSLAGGDINTGNFGETMKSLGEAMKKHVAADEGQPWSRPNPIPQQTAAEGLGDGWMGTLGRGASKLGEWSAKASQKISENVAPGFETPKINPPAFGDLKTLSLPSAETGGKMLMIVAIVAALAFAGWLLLRKSEIVLAGGPLFSRRARLSLAGLPPREQAALLFEHAALDRLGEPARPKNHVALAEKLCTSQPSDSHVLAEVYEAARYTPPSEPFQADKLNVVKEIISRNRPPAKTESPRKSSPDDSTPENV